MISMTSIKSKSISISMECYCDRIQDGQMFCALSHESQVIEKKTDGILERNLQFQEQNQVRRLGSVLTKGGRLYLNVFIADLIQTGQGGGGRSPTQYKVCTSHLMGLYLRLSTFCQCQRLAMETSWCLTLECILALSAIYIDFRLLVMTRLCGAVQLISCIILVPQYPFYTAYFP